MPDQMPSTAKNIDVSKTEMTLTMLHPRHLDPKQMSDTDLAYHMDAGEIVAARTSQTTVEVADADVETELAAIGGTTTFFERTDSISSRLLGE